MNGPTPERFDSLITRLTDELDEASAGLRVTTEWKSVRGVVEDHGSRRDELVADDEALDVAIRTLEAQGDLLALARDEVAEAERHAGQERSRREREDRQIVQAVTGFLRPYSLLSVAAVVLVPVIGIPFGEVALVCALPAIWAYLEMKRRADHMTGRAWVILNDDVRDLEGRVKLYDIITAVGVGLAVLWFIGSMIKRFGA